MTTPIIVAHREPLPGRVLALLLIILLAAALAGCGSTKVYTADKTITYRGTLYNMSGVRQVSPLIEVTLPDGSTVDTTRFDKDAVKDLFDSHDELVVATYIVMDGDKVVYERKTVDNRGDYDDLADDLEDAMDDVNDFMADKKDTQLELD